jgi:hypothetical protein
MATKQAEANSTHHTDVLNRMRRDPAAVHDEHNPAGGVATAAAEEAALADAVDAVGGSYVDEGDGTDARPEYNPDTDPRFGDREPENRTPDRLAQRRISTVTALLGVQADLTEMVKVLTEGSIDSDEALRNFNLTYYRFARMANSAGIMANRLAVDMLKTDQERHDAAMRRPLVKTGPGGDFTHSH